MAATFQYFHHPGASIASFLVLFLVNDVLGMKLELTFGLASLQPSGISQAGLCHSGGGGSGRPHTDEVAKAGDHLIALPDNDRDCDPPVAAGCRTDWAFCCRAVGCDAVLRRAGRCSGRWSLMAGATTVFGFCRCLRDAFRMCITAWRNISAIPISADQAGAGAESVPRAWRLSRPASVPARARRQIPDSRDICAFRLYFRGRGRRIRSHSSRRDRGFFRTSHRRAAAACAGDITGSILSASWRAHRIWLSPSPPCRPSSIWAWRCRCCRPMGGPRPLPFIFMAARRLFSVTLLLTMGFALAVGRQRPKLTTRAEVFAQCIGSA